MLLVSNLMILWLEVDSEEDLADFGSAGANPGAGGESDLTVAPGKPRGPRGPKLQINIQNSSKKIKRSTLSVRIWQESLF